MSLKKDLPESGTWNLAETAPFLAQLQVQTDNFWGFRSVKAGRLRNSNPMLLLDPVAGPAVSQSRALCVNSLPRAAAENFSVMAGRLPASSPKPALLR